MTLKDDTPLDVTLDDLAVKLPEPDAIMDFLTRMEFRTLTKRVADKLGLEAPALPESGALEVKGAHVETKAPAERLPFDHSSYECIRDLDALNRWIAHIRDIGHVAVDTETTSLDEMRADGRHFPVC